LSKASPCLFEQLLIKHKIRALHVYSTDMDY
jgi:hypothetical protein